ncbi:hypothetical protein [Frigoriglobus tundricola]|uniref:Uncharacterized protein n=1 Tax=Frigoriglobus tundricola TaxID=2774151 RepID=A0A6M5YL30_9BACT|nr:hypothetical protein [Frigoriglobus tundricola]QJW94727.1 hypothetical protein FTUN_2249 [Frigoriglobus tundricola]
MLVSEDTKIVVSSPAVAAGTGDVTGAVIDMQQDGGYSNVLFLVVTGDVTATSVLELTAQTSPNSDGSSPTQCATTGTRTCGATDTDNKILELDVAGIGPGRYVLPVLHRTVANAAINCILAVLYRANKLPAPLSTDEVLVAIKVVH